MKNSFKLKLVAAAVLMASGVAYAGTGSVSLGGNALTPVVGDGSQSNPYGLGSIGFPATTLLVTLGGSPGESFEEYANFTIPQLSGAYGSANTYPLSISLPVFGNLALHDIKDLTIEVWDNTHPLGNINFSTFPGNNTTTFIGNLGAGQYHLDISGHLGDAPSIIGGQYSVALAALPVPEPETYAMLLAGLGLIGFSVRRRAA